MAGQSYFFGKTVDDLMKICIEAIQAYGKRVESSRGRNTELTGVLLELEDPRARLSRTETRGKPFSCLGELLWYLSKSDSVDPIKYYIHRYSEFQENGKIYGGYGPRLFQWGGKIDQVSNIKKLLTAKPSTRKAVIQLFSAEDLISPHKDIPCTCSLQFSIRDNKLHMFTYMRSNDVYWGLPHDVFSFTMLQEIMARSVGVEIGSYKHAVGSLHLYDDHVPDAELFINEGWQSTQHPMPPMPAEDPTCSIQQLLAAECQIREGGAEAFSIPESLDNYWADLIRLLQILRHFKENNVDKVKGIQQNLTCELYHTFINKRLQSKQ